MPIAPYGVTATGTGPDSILIEGYCGDNYLTVDLYFGASSTSFATLAGPWSSGEKFSYSDTSITSTYWNTPLYYTASGVTTGHSDKTASNNVTLWHETVNLYIAALPVPVDSSAGSKEATANVWAHVEPRVTETVAWHDTVSVSVGASVTVSSSQSIRDNYAYFFGTSDGKVHQYGQTYKSDNGSPISAYWISKIFDMSDVSAEYMSRWKTIYRIKVKYVDKSASLPITLSISTDNRAFVALPTQTVGIGDNGQKDAYFFPIFTGKYFQVKVEFNSASTTFQLDGIEIEFTACGEEFPTR
jgi:hypothetical protein